LGCDSFLFSFSYRTRSIQQSNKWNSLHRYGLIGPRSNKPLPGATAVCPHLTDVRHTPLRKDTDFMSTPNWALSPIKRGPDTTLPPAPFFPFSERKKIRKQKPADNMSPYSKHQTATRVPKHTRKAVFVNPS
jgi:hypothetical protein